MWIFTRYGFYSIACASKQDGSLDPDTVMVRARSKDHLRNLQERLPSLAGAEILVTPDGDYRYRILVAKRVWAALLFDLAAEQEWSNFKNEVGSYQGEEGEEYVHILHRIWATLAHVQERDSSGKVRRSPDVRL